MRALLMANLMILGVAQWLPDGHQDRSNNTFVHCHWNNLDVGMTWKRPCVFIVCEVKSTKSRLEEYHVGYELMEVDALKGEGNIVVLALQNHVAVEDAFCVVSRGTLKPIAR